MNDGFTLIMFEDGEVWIMLGDVTDDELWSEEDLDKVEDMIEQYECVAQSN